MSQGKVTPIALAAFAAGKWHRLLVLCLGSIFGLGALATRQHDHELIRQKV